MEAKIMDAKYTEVETFFDYDLQVWIIEGTVQTCGHPDDMRIDGKPCCNANEYAGRDRAEVIKQLTTGRD